MVSEVWPSYNNKNQGDEDDDDNDDDDDWVGIKVRNVFQCLAIV